MKDIGLVFSGGGGKGAYQIGVWDALRILKLEDRVAVVSGTSVGALNAALFLKGNWDLAARIWNRISGSALLPFNTENDDALFSSRGLEDFVSEALSVKDRNNPPLCYAACKRIRDGQIRYFELQGILDSGYRKQILMASAAIPAVFSPVFIKGEPYIDGGANGDNVPVRPVFANRLPVILVVHLSRQDAPCQGKWPGTAVYDLYPSQSLGGFFDGVLDFDPCNAAERCDLGRRDALAFLSGIHRLYERPPEPAVSSGHLFPERSNLNRISEKTARTKRDSDGDIETNNGGKEYANMEKVKFEQEAIRKQYEERVEQLRQIALSPQMTTRVLWDATVAKYARTVERVRNLMSQDELQGEVSPRLDQQMRAFLAKCEKQEFHIALVGAIKAGKSSLINAMLDEELASTEVTPETASLTKFRGGQSDCVSISFYSLREWEELWKSANPPLETKRGQSPEKSADTVREDSRFMQEYRELHAEKEKDNWVGHAPVYVECDSREALKEEIRKWTSSRYATHYFVKAVEVYLKDFPLPEGVVLVDTPGLNDAVEYRSNITKDYIDRANAVFVCVKADKLTGPELATIVSVFSNARYHPEKIYIIGTQQDMLNDPEEDWKKQRRDWLGHLREKSCYGGMELAEKNLLSTSGYFYTLLKNQASLDKKRKYQLGSMVMRMQCDPEELGEKYEDFLDFTGIDYLRRRMNTDIVSKYQDILREDIASSYETVKENVAELVRRIRQTQEEILADSAKSIEEIRAKEAENRQKLEEARKDQEELGDLFETIKQDAADRKAQIAKAIRELGGKK